MPPLTLSNLDPTANVAIGVMLAVASVRMTGVGITEAAKKRWGSLRNETCTAL